MEVVQALDIIGGDAFFLHLFAVVGDVVINVTNLLDQALALESTQLVPGHSFDLRLIHWHTDHSYLF